MGGQVNFVASAIAIIIALYINCAQCGELQELYRWQQIGYKNINRLARSLQDKRTMQNSQIYFPDQTLDGQTGNNNEANDQNGQPFYIPANNIPMGVTHSHNRLFVTVPRRRYGIPSTLNVINMDEEDTESPLLTPYPSFQANELHPLGQADPERIVSVYRSQIDVCGRLWFVDTGTLELPNNPIQVQRPSIWVINLTNGRRIRRFEIPESIVQRGNGMPSITVDVQKKRCDNAFAYIPDIAAYQLSVYSFAENRMWRFQHNYFSFDPLQGDLNVGGAQFQWNDGIFSVTLGPRQPDQYRVAFFHAMASTNEFGVSTRVLQNETLASRSYHNNDFFLFGNRGSDTQSAMHDIDEKTGIMFYAEVGRNGVGCWNTNDPFLAENHGLAYQNADTMIYPADLNVDREGNLWVLSNKLPRWIYSSLNFDEVNFRIWKTTGAQAASGTVCDKN